MGDPSGIGPEICARALLEPSVQQRCIPVLFGDAGVFDLLAKRGLPKPNVPVCSLAQWEVLGELDASLIVDCAATELKSLEPGMISAQCGRAAYAYMRHSIDAAMKGRLSGVITAPIHKESLRLAGIEHPGHTEIFTSLTGAPRSCMMLYSEELTVSMVTTHIGYADVPRKLGVGRVHDVITLTHQAMKRMLQREPKLAICGLNPHAGEHGLFGQKEEEECVEPAVAQARQAGIQIVGPLPPDTAFTASVRAQVDAIVTLYHDQGHIPFKMLAFDTGVNITLGLPIIRTSVDHGTAFDIAWKGKASPTSLFAAVRVAADLAEGRTTQESAA
jgi:4-hydroxythreonine-4-phosphate dehydrogenase